MDVKQCPCRSQFNRELSTCCDTAVLFGLIDTAVWQADSKTNAIETNEMRSCAEK